MKNICALSMVKLWEFGILTKNKILLLILLLCKLIKFYASKPTVCSHVLINNNHAFIKNLGKFEGNCVWEVRE